MQFNLALAQVDAGASSTTELPAFVPVNGTSGRISVITRHGSTISDDYFFIPPNPFVASDVEYTGVIAPGESESVNISTANKIGLIVFEGSTGQRVSFVVNGPSNLYLKIYAPDGTEIYDQSGSASHFTDLQILPQDGTYTVVVDPNSSGVGSYSLTMHEVPPDDSTTIVAGGPSVNLSTTVPGQNGVGVFNGTVGQRISLLVTGSVSHDVRIYNPSGSQIYSNNSSGTSFSDVITLTSAGIYTIEVDPSGTGMGGFSLTLYEVPADDSATIIPDGPSVSLSTSIPGQNANATFVGTAGQIVSLTVNGTVTHDVNIYDPSGTELYSNSSSGTLFTDAVTLPANGVYTILVDPSGTGTGDFTLTLNDLSPINTTIIAGGPAVSVSTTVPGQNVNVTFSGTVGQRVSLTVDGTVSRTVTVFNPNGSELYVKYDSGLQFTGVLTLTESGTYTIHINPPGTSTGDFTLTLYDVPPDDSAAIIIDGPPVTLSTTVMGQNANATFTGSAGQRVSLTVSGPVGRTVTVFNPDGSELYVKYATGTQFTDVLTLPVSGTYDIFVNPKGMGIGDFTLTLYDVPPDDSASITIGGASVTLSTTVMGQNASATFTGTAGQNISLIVSGTVGRTVTIFNPDGSELYVKYASGTQSSGVKTLPETGTYTIFVNPKGMGIGDFILTLFAEP